MVELGHERGRKIVFRFAVLSRGQTGRVASSPYREMPAGSYNKDALGDSTIGSLAIDDVRRYSNPVAD